MDDQDPPTPAEPAERPATRLRELLAPALGHLGDLAEAHRHYLRPTAAPVHRDDDEVLAAAARHLSSRRRELERAGRGDGDAARALDAALEVLGAAGRTPPG